MWKPEAFGSILHLRDGREQHPGKPALKEERVEDDAQEDWIIVWEVHWSTESIPAFFR
jgi:hypothetical protein